MYRFTLTKTILADLGRLDKLRARLDNRGVLPRRWIGRMRRDLEAGAFAASTSMEGIPVTVEDVRRILAGDLPSGVKEGDAALVRGYRDAMGLVLRRADDPGFAWETELIRGIHDRVMAGDYASGAGRYRTKPVHLATGAEGRIVYSPPPADRIMPLVGELVSWLQGAPAVPVPVVAAVAHARIAGIHPFADGNGRTARILTSLVMFRGGFRLPEFTSLEEWWGTHLSDYYKAFACLGDTWDQDADITPFISAHVRAQRVQVESLSLRQATEREIWTILEDLAVEDLGGNPRMADALHDAFFGRDVTNRYYRGLSDVTAATAANDLGRLVSAGMLSTKGAGRSTLYVGTRRLAEAVAKSAGLPSGEGLLEKQRSAIVAALASRLRSHGLAPGS